MPNAAPTPDDRPDPVKALIDDLTRTKVLSDYPGRAPAVERPEMWPSVQLARRYAELAAAASGYTETINALAEHLANSEWHRSEAERTVDELTGRLNFGEQQLINGTDPQPDDEITVLLDITTGRLWHRPLRSDGTPAFHWQQTSEHSKSVLYEWPIENAGPFIAVADDWTVRNDAHRHRRAHDELAAARAAVIRHGRRIAPDALIGRPLPEMIDLLAQDHFEHVVQVGEAAARQADEKVQLLEQQLAELRAEFVDHGDRDHLFGEHL